MIRVPFLQLAQIIQCKRAANTKKAEGTPPGNQDETQQNPYKTTGLLNPVLNKIKPSPKRRRAFQQKLQPSCKNPKPLNLNPPKPSDSAELLPGPGSWTEALGLGPFLGASSKRLLWGLGFRVWGLGFRV